MDVSLTVVGAVFVAIAIVGGGLRFGGVVVPSLSRPRIIVLGIFGLITMVLGLTLEWSSAPVTASPPGFADRHTILSVEPVVQIAPADPAP